MLPIKAYENYVSSLPQERLVKIVRGLLLVIAASPEASYMLAMGEITPTNDSGKADMKAAMDFVQEAGKKVPLFNAGMN